MKRFYFISFLFFSFLLTAQNNPSALKKFEETPALQHAHYGISIRNLETGEEIESVHSTQSFAPASNLKLLYTLTAIEKKGKKNFTYETRLMYSGKIVRSMLFGDLVFQASGDPSFASIRMNDKLQKEIAQIISRIKNRGIRKISGKLVMELNGWRYPAPGSWPIEDIGNYYGTGAWGFNFNDNRLDIYLQRSTQVGAPTKVLFTKPEIKDITYISKVTTANPDTDDEAYIYAAPFTKTRYILGTIPAGEKAFRVKGGMPNPPKAFLQILQKELAKNGIIVEDIQVRYTQKTYQHMLWKYTSKPLIDLVKYTNDYSINHFSEALAWLLINGDKPANGYLDKEKINDFFTEYGFEEADIEDGCGLAPDNLVQPAQMTSFLKLMSEKLGKETVLDILPHGGEDGYGKYFLQNSEWQKNVWVKSGSVSKVRNYTGIFKAKSGKFYSFSIMTNYFIGKHSDVRKAIEKLLINYIENL